MLRGSSEKGDDGRIEHVRGDRPHLTATVRGPNNASNPRGGLTPRIKPGGLSDHRTPDAAVWGHSPDEPVWRVVIVFHDRGGRGPRGNWSNVS